MSKIINVEEIKGKYYQSHRRRTDNTYRDLDNSGYQKNRKTIKEYRMVFRVGLRDPCTRVVARLSESVKILEPQASVFLRVTKVEQHPKCVDHAFLLGKPFGNCFIK
jgi:hypothetical protein